MWWMSRAVVLVLVVTGVVHGVAGSVAQWRWGSVTVPQADVSWLQEEKGLPLVETLAEEVEPAVEMTYAVFTIPFEDVVTYMGEELPAREVRTGLGQIPTLILPNSTAPAVTLQCGEDNGQWTSDDDGDVSPLGWLLPLPPVKTLRDINFYTADESLCMTSEHGCVTDTAHFLLVTKFRSFAFLDDNKDITFEKQVIPEIDFQTCVLDIHVGDGGFQDKNITQSASGIYTLDVEKANMDDCLFSSYTEALSSYMDVYLRAMAQLIDVDGAIEEAVSLFLDENAQNCLALETSVRG